MQKNRGSLGTWNGGRGNNPYLRPCPWGQIDKLQLLAPGIVNVYTPGHGGIWLAEFRQQQLPYSDLARRVNFLGSLEWWEEDQDWAIPVLVFSRAIQPLGDDWFHAARWSVERFHPEYWAAWAASEGARV